MTSIKVPPLGESITEAIVSRWLKAEGEAVAPGDTIVELETDKITVEVPSLAGGVLARHLHAEGDVVHVDDALAEVDETAKPAAGPVAPAPVVAAPKVAPPPAAPAPAPASASAVRASPAAERLAAESRVDLSRVAGTGLGGVVSKPDVVDAIAARPSAPPSAPALAAAPPAAPSVPTVPTVPAAHGVQQRETREKMSTRRKRIAENLLQAQHATAHLTTFNEIDMTAVNALRARLRDRVEKEHGVKLSFMPFFVKAACQALATYPMVNAQIDGESIVYKHYVNMGIAVASDAGLVVPNIKDADGMGLLEIAREMNAVADRARRAKLTMDDLTGGTFTITNGGVFGSLISTPILNYPQVGILGLHKIQERPVALDGQVVIRPMMYIALSYDHRIVDGQQAVLFLVRVKELMEEPGAMLVE
ncbi:MAG TPA: 2-oxoglutarate dehydrogenase complex dihydrolipoyllysine-residue succinyltransferase [Gemmatimonadaceae bacterium]|nr:2-oxoglutarate dehydrogenase complex dihydrolipoyllysine-residue succinyltransferase [Gemmatimonadaceae bacterium]